MPAKLKNEKEDFKKDLSKFLSKKSDSQKTSSDLLDLAKDFQKSFPFYRIYTKEIVAAEIDIILSTQIL